VPRQRNTAQTVGTPRESATFGIRQQVLMPLPRDLEMNVRVHQHRRIVLARGRVRIVDAPRLGA